MLGDLFLPSCETPEAPRMGFFKNWFGSTPSQLDREELCKHELLFWKTIKTVFVLCSSFKIISHILQVLDFVLKKFIMASLRLGMYFNKALYA